MSGKIKISKGGIKKFYKPRIHGSKSISNRVLIINALSKSNKSILNLSNSDDTKRLKNYIDIIKTCHESDIPLIIDCANAGTVMRFLTAYLSLEKGKWLLSGSERMLERPINNLVEALNEIGIDIKYPQKKQFPPILINPSDIKKNQVAVNPSKSSQFVSALLLVAPYIKGGLVISLSSKPVSESYINMTIDIMREFGVIVRKTNNKLLINENSYVKRDYSIETDWSSAAFWYQIVAFNKQTSIEIQGLKEQSFQGDSVLKDVFLELGVKTHFTPNSAILSGCSNQVNSIEFDASNSPDIVPVLLSTCAGLGVKAKIFGVSHLKYKESDRLTAMKTELEKINCKLDISDNQVDLFPSDNLLTAEFDTYDDHRIAMSLAPLASLLGECVINNPNVVNKSYPDFWDHISEFGYKISNNF